MPTTNPVPSADPSDLVFNAGTFDRVVNGEAPDFTDRFGRVKKTVAGSISQVQAAAEQALAVDIPAAIGTVAAINSRGNWASGTAYAIKDIVLTGGTWYICIAAHTSGASFATDEASKWRVYQGLTTGDLGYQVAEVQDVLDSAKPMANYTALRAYTGRATAVRITTQGIAGIFQRDSDTTTADNGGTVIVDASGRRWKRLFDGAVSVKWFGAKGDATTDDAPAIQLAVNFAIASGVRRVFFPFSQRERYFLSATVTIESSGFYLEGDVAPIYSPENGGYIFAPAGVTDLFDYGNGRTDLGSNQFVADGIAFYSNTGFTQNAIKFTQNNNGPHRGFLLRNCAGRGFVNIALFDVPTSSNLSVATVDVQNCVFLGNTNTVNAVERAFGLRYVGNQSEQGARITGFWDSGITITDNMLEGQSNPINIDSNSPTVHIQNNYFEAISGDYIARVRGTNGNATLDVKPNYISNILCTDVYRVENVVRLREADILTLPFTRKALVTTLGAFLACGSDISGKLYTGTGTAEGVSGFTAPMRMAGVLPSSAVLKQDLGAVALQTPFGDTKTGVSVNGFPATYYSLEKSWAAGDVLVCCALVRIESGEQPYFNIYNESFGQPGVSAGQQTIQPLDNDGWFLMFSARATTSAGTTCRFRFGSNGTAAGATNLRIAAVGVDVVSAAEFVTFNSTSRAFVRLFNPFIPNKPIEASTAYDPPSLATGSGASTAIGITGVALGDYVEVSFDQPLQGITLTAFASNPGQVTARFQNQTGSTIDLASGTLRFRVRKA